MSDEAREADAAPLSRNQQKRAILYEKQRAHKKQKKEAAKAAKRAAREAGQAAWEALPEEERAARRTEAKAVRQDRMAAAVAAKAAASASASAPVPAVVIDLDFDALMTERERTSLACQLGYCYSANRNAGFSLRLHLSSLHGRMAAQVARVGGSENWPVARHESSYLEAFDRDSLVYLSSESEHVLDALDPARVYVIGGLVDHNRHKGLTHSRAVAAGIATARLPIAEHVDTEAGGAGRRVLAVNHVFEILALRASGVAWPEALLRTIPQRRHRPHASQPEQVEGGDEDEGGWDGVAVGEGAEAEASSPGEDAAS